MRSESLRDAAELDAYEQIEEKHGYVSWRQTYAEFLELVTDNLRSRKFVQAYNKTHPDEVS